MTLKSLHFLREPHNHIEGRKQVLKHTLPSINTQFHNYCNMYIICCSFIQISGIFRFGVAYMLTSHFLYNSQMQQQSIVADPLDQELDLFF